MQLNGNATDVSVDPALRVAVVAEGSGGLAFINVADPTAPVILAVVPGVNASHVLIANGVAFAAVGTRLQTYDLLTGLAIQSLNLTGGTITGLARDGSFLYTIDSSHVLRIFDISGAVPVARGTLTLPNGGGNIFVGNNVAYVAATETSPAGSRPLTFPILPIRT